MRVGCAMSAVVLGPVRDVPRLGLGVHPVDHLPAFRLAVAGPVVRVAQRHEGRLDRRDGRGLVGRRHLLQPPPAGSPPGQVQVDLHRAAGPARLRLADGLAGRRAAVGRLRLREQAQVHQHLAGVDRQELRRKAVVRRDKRRRLLRHQRLHQRQRRVRALVRPPEEPLALRHPAVGRAVHLHVVIRRVRLAVVQLRRDQAQELVLELVGDRVARPAPGRAGSFCRMYLISGWSTSPSTAPARRTSPR